MAARPMAYGRPPPGFPPGMPGLPPGMPPGYPGGMPPGMPPAGYDLNFFWRNHLLIKLHQYAPRFSPSRIPRSAARHAVPAGSDAPWVGHAVYSPCSILIRPQIPRSSTSMRRRGGANVDCGMVPVSLGLATNVSLHVTTDQCAHLTQDRACLKHACENTEPSRNRTSLISGSEKQIDAYVSSENLAVCNSRERGDYRNESPYVRGGEGGRRRVSSALGRLRVRCSRNPGEDVFLSGAWCSRNPGEDVFLLLWIGPPYPCYRLDAGAREFYMCNGIFVVVVETTR